MPLPRTIGMGRGLLLNQAPRPSQAQRIFATQPANLIAHWPLDDASGTTARDTSGKGRVGTYVGLPTLGQSVRPFTCPSFNSSVTTQYVRVDGSAGNLINWAEGSITGSWRGPLANWSDATIRRLVLLQIDTSNRITISTAGSADTINVTYQGGGVSKTVQITNLTMLSSGWKTITVTWSKTFNRLRVYLDDVLVAEVTGLPTIVGSTMTLGQLGQQGTNVFVGNIAQVALWSTELTPAEVANIAYPDALWDKLIVADGDSLTVGGQSGAIPWTKQLMQAHTSEEWRLRSFAVSGQKLSDMLSDLTSQIIPALDTVHFAQTDLVPYGGTNDCTNESAATAYGRLVQYCQIARAAKPSARIVPCTLQAGAPAAAGGTFNTTRNGYNGMVRPTWPTFADALADLAANPNIGPDGAENNAAYFLQTDHQHYTTLGQAEAASVFGPLM